LTGWEVHHTEHQLSHEVPRSIVLGDLRARVLEPDLGTKVDSELVGRLARLRKLVGLYDPADADVYLHEVVVADLVHPRS